MPGSIDIPFAEIIYTPDYPIDEAVEVQGDDIDSFILSFVNIRFPELARNDPDLISKVVNKLSEVDSPAIKHLQAICERLMQTAYNPD